MDGWLDQEMPKKRFLLLVWYQGNWNPYCKAHLQDLNEIMEDVHQMGGELFAISAQSQKEADKTKKEWGLQFPCLGDERNAIANVINDRGLVKVKITPRSGYTYGITQPAILALTNKAHIQKRRNYEDGDYQILFSWASEPEPLNFFGLTGQPYAEDIWDIINVNLTHGPMISHTLDGVKEDKTMSSTKMKKIRSWGILSIPIAQMAVAAFAFLLLLFFYLLFF